MCEWVCRKEQISLLVKWRGSNILVYRPPEETAAVSYVIHGDHCYFLDKKTRALIDRAPRDIPETVILEVVEADPVVKGQTAASSYKPAVLSNGVKTMVPPFITTGERIVVKTEDASYYERAKG